MATNLTLEWGDGYLAIMPEIPDFLRSALRYWHRSLSREEGKAVLVATGEYRELYSISGHITPDNRFEQRLVTLPGFLCRVKNLLRAQGYEYTIVDKRTPNPNPDYAKAFEGLRDYQCACTYAALASGGGIIACPTGWGKTHIIASIIKAYSHDELCMRNTPKVVVATPEQDITRKDFNDLVKLLPDREIGLVMTGSKHFSDDVQVITLQSLPLLDCDDIGIFIVDEVHTAASEKRMEVIMSARRALKWGVSATPAGRFDGRDLVTEGLFGPLVYQRTYAEGVADGALVPIKVYWVKAPVPEHVRNLHCASSMGLENYMKFKTRSGKYRNGVDRNDEYNQIVAQLLTKIPPELQTLCILQHLDHMDKMVYHCPGIKTVHAEESADNLRKKGCNNLLPVPKKDRRQTYDDMNSGTCRKIVSTYVYKQGVNFPQLTVVVNAGGGGSDIVAKQIPGRESRNIGEGKPNAFLVDFVHEWDTLTDKNGRVRPGPILKDDKSREKAYTDLGFDQVWLDTIDELPFLKANNGPTG